MSGFGSELGIINWNSTTVIWNQVWSGMGVMSAREHRNFLAKRFQITSATDWAPQHLCTSPIHTWNSGTSSWRSLYLFCHPHKEDSSHDQLWGWWECHLLRCDQRQEKTENQSAECGVVLLCSLFWSPENNLFHVGYCLSPILNSILGFEEEESKDGYHWLTSEFY